MSQVSNEVIGRKHLNSHTTTKIIDQKGNQITEQQEICNKFNNFFSNIGQNISKTIPLCTTSNNPSSIISQHKKSFFFTPITSNEIMIQIGKLDNKKSPGIDKIQNKFLKYVGDIICPFLAEIFINHITLGKFPQELKTAKIVPIHKNGSHSLTTNYRPISILSSFSKIFEKCIYKRLYKYLTSKNILSHDQFGFQQGHSTTLAVIDIYNKILHSIEQKKYTCAVFLDLKKAFDTVNHSILLNKLHKYGIRGNMHELLSDYLTNRTQVTVLHNIISQPNVLNTGVPQGSTLGPLLFLIYINDLPLISNFSTRLFADDNCLIMTDSNLKLLNKKVNIEINKVSNG